MSKTPHYDEYKQRNLIPKVGQIYAIRKYPEHLMRVIEVDIQEGWFKYKFLTGDLPDNRASIEFFRIAFTPYTKC